MPGPQRRHLLDRLMAKVVRNEAGCWVWTGAVAGKGYGKINYDAKLIYTHRASYVMLVGPIPDGYQIDHLCGVLRCANPAHLEAVSPQENNRRSQSPTARLARQTHCFLGHEFTPENTYPYRGTRNCRACMRRRDRKRYPKRYADQKRRLREARAAEGTP